ncbi:putative enzyme [Candidatus Propionivibrio aalborgensis]|jgi:pyridoxal phosphate enzyme (YggS family)|uniref:Pyridoxal phosphate homeostasis protein n=1 Tax=Candidatus Propionivibrio aalborgensis TaxID=1860101 RepID=A0A1A8Y1R7_9RHOO|nr:YggS family pyridoxal phosphate-dependent enzyme [Candidatus Propionivibrio aalborgensis]MBK7325850.1 YggS family pyridoxal phosphate-dependent enzyme [Propionivibrio sp.]MBK7563646.1 YggS family pyridoxal phosphate-dependent enzyme [Propionivibrio sp.]MBK9026906.1 YggS family pyridoxal phosphate-dependent enzyme [Propionivibrio sp.]SBT11070.1 putative enzyme [Candidatus Propionivibrio aalborgensis]HRC59415.1 YggS family pyridoxal phosphate-dependent enzyme [Candidatus Propionivibrio aalbor
MTTISANLQAVLARIFAAARKYGRNPDDISLLAVSKTWPASVVREAAVAGQQAFGENYVQEGAAKIAELGSLGLVWHFIGPLQSNKAKQVATAFDWVHSVDRLKIAERLSEQRPDSLAPLQVCLQVNVSGEKSKSGTLMDDLSSLAHRVALLPRLKLRGLMAIPAPVEDFAQQRKSFRRLREAFERLKESGLLLDTLSMGMSHDLEAAVAEGASIVRVGTAIFGARSKS